MSITMYLFVRLENSVLGKSLYHYVPIFLTGVRLGVRVSVGVSVSPWDSHAPLRVLLLYHGAFWAQYLSHDYSVH